MKIEKLDFSDTGSFSGLFLDYVANKKELRDLYRYYPSIESFGKIIEERTFSKEQKIKLQEVLSAEYGALERSDAVTNNLLSLSGDKTFTVTTGHQLNIFTGPLYFIYKIVTTINLAKSLKEAYPDYHFVPIYWMASEDHDFEEINHFNLFGKKYTWKTNQTGAVGRFAPQSLNEVIEEIGVRYDLFEKAYLDSSSLADAVRFYCNELFGDEGLIVIDADDRVLKSQFADVIKKELVEQKANKIVEESNKKLKELGYTGQAFSREINFFYLNGSRDRILYKEGEYSVKGTDLKYTQEEILNLVDFEPERFSPNVIMRPVYQEVILPNIAYIGGPAEIAYWLQLKQVFEYFETSFPLLVPRNFAMQLNATTAKKATKLNLSAKDLFRDAHSLKVEYLKNHAENTHLLDKEKEELTSLFSKVKKKAVRIDGSLDGYVAAEGTRAAKHLDHIETKLRKANEKQNDIAMEQIDYVIEHVAPYGNLQERYENFLSFQINNPNFLNTLLDNFDPLDFRFYQFWEV